MEAYVSIGKDQIFGGVARRIYKIIWPCDGFRPSKPKFKWTVYDPHELVVNEENEKYFILSHLQFSSSWIILVPIKISEKMVEKKLNSVLDSWLLPKIFVNLLMKQIYTLQFFVF